MTLMVAKKATVPPGKKGHKPSKKTLEALARGRQKRDANNAHRKETGMTARARLQQLLSGELTIADLDSKELRRGRLHDGNGSYQGKPLKLPARISDQMHAEFMRRTIRMLNKYGMKAAKLLVESMDDPEVDPRIQHDARKYILERFIGKVPDVVHVGPENEFDRLQQGAVIFNREELGDDQEGEG